MNIISVLFCIIEPDSQISKAVPAGVFEMLMPEIKKTLIFFC